MNTREKLKLFRNKNEDFQQFMRRYPETAEKFLYCGSELSKTEDERTVKHLFTDEDNDRIWEFLYHKNSLVKTLLHLCEETDEQNKEMLKNMLVGEFSTNAHLYYTLNEWSKGRICYSYTEEMADHLIESFGDTEEKSIPTEALRHIPYDSFFIDSRNITDDEHVIGMIVSKNDSTLQIVLMETDINSNDLSSESLYIPLGKEITFSDLYKGMDKVKNENIEDKLNLLQKAGHNTNENDLMRITSTEERQVQLKSIAVKMLPLVLYLSTEKPDIKEAINPQASAGKKTDPRKNVHKENVRYTVGEDFS